MKLDAIVAGNDRIAVTNFAEVLKNAALKEGFGVHYYLNSPPGEPWGPHKAHIRVASPPMPSPKIPRGVADILVAFDSPLALSEGEYLKAKGLAVVDETTPMPAEVRIKGRGYPARDEVDTLYDHERAVWVPATNIAKEHGSTKATFAVLLGVFSALNHTVDRDNLVISLRERMGILADMSAECFFSGYSLVTGHDH